MCEYKSTVKLLSKDVSLCAFKTKSPSRPRYLEQPGMENEEKWPPLSK